MLAYSPCDASINITCACFTKTPDIYSTCYIPANTISLPNSYTVVRDETAVGSEVTAFTPGPCIDANGKLKDLTDVGFGVGRRICAGRHIARSGLFIKVARLLWAFEIVPGVDRITGGTIIVSDINCVDGLVVLPKPFKAVFRRDAAPYRMWLTLMKRWASTITSRSRMKPFESRDFDVAEVFTRISY